MPAEMQQGGEGSFWALERCDLGQPPAGGPSVTALLSSDLAPRELRATHSPTAVGGRAAPGAWAQAPATGALSQTARPTFILTPPPTPTPRAAPSQTPNPKGLASTCLLTHPA